MAKNHKTSSMFHQLEDAIFEEIEKLWAKNVIDEEKLGEVAVKSIDQLTTDEPEYLALELKKSSARMLRNRRKTEKGFRRRSFRRWKPAFDQIEIVWHASEEVGREFNAEFRPDAASNNDFVFEVLTRMHGRGLLVAKEAIHLLKGGFPDGALSRWRTLHEIFVVTMFINEHGQQIAERYLASSEFTRYKTAKQLNEYSDRANLSKFSEEEIADFERRKNSLEVKYGKEMRNPYGWARPAFPNLAKKKKLNFMDIEEDTALDHWRPRYKWASQHTHAGHRDLGSLLAQAESNEQLILVGESNSGFVDPLQMTALHISSLTTILLLLRPNIDTTIMAQSITILAKEVADIAQATEQSTFEKAQAGQFKKRFRFFH